MSADKDGVRKKDRDPILSVGFVVLLLAFAGVIGIFVNDHYIKGDSGPTATVGSTVTVNYTGSYYGYYYEDGAKVFDTSLYSVASNENLVKSFEFTMKNESQYATISFSPGVSTTYLQMFMNSVIGHKAGDKVTMAIDPTNGYGALTDEQIGDWGMSGSMAVSETVTLSQFEKIYGFKPTGNSSVDTTPYGWPAQVYLEGTSLVRINHQPDNGETYKMNDDVSVKITNIVTGHIEFDYIIEFESSLPKSPAYDDEGVTEYGGKSYDNVKLVKIVIDNKEYYITAVDDLNNVGEFLTKTAESVSNGDRPEATGMYLYFELEIVKVS